MVVLGGRRERKGECHDNTTIKCATPPLDVVSVVACLNAFELQGHYARLMVPAVRDQA